MPTQTITSSRRPATIPSPPLFVAFVVVIAVLLMAAMLSRNSIEADGSGSSDVIMTGP